MNGQDHRTISNIQKEITRQDAATSTSNPYVEDVGTTTRTVYGSFYWFFRYLAMFLKRLGKDLFQSFLCNVYSDRVLPDHIADLIKVHKILQSEREDSGTYSRYRLVRRMHDSPAIENSIADDIILMNSIEPAFSSFDSGSTLVLLSNNIPEPTSENIIPKRTRKQTILKKNAKYGGHDAPSTSKECPLENVQSIIEHASVSEYGSESLNELQMLDINLQSDNDLNIDSAEVDSKSIVLAYLRNKSLTEVTNRSTMKKPPLLESVSKMETIVESEQCTSESPAFRTASEEEVLKSMNN